MSRERRTAAVLFVAALMVYGATLGARDVWGEECFLVQDRPWAVLASFLSMDRWAGRPPLFYAVRSLSVSALGVGPWGMRLPALLFGAAAVPATWLLARRVLPPPAALLAALALLCAALPGYFARESHVYSLSVLLTACLGHVALDITQGRDPGRRAAWLSLASLWSSIMLWPLTALLGLGGAAWLARTGGAARRFAKGQALAWGVSASLWALAFLRLRARGGGVLGMGGEDGDGESFDENGVLITLERAIDGLVFSHQSPLGGTGLETWLPLCTAAAVVALALGRRSGWSLGALAIGGFLGGLAPFWLLSWGFGHDHRLDTRYFVHLAPLVVIAWAAALAALPRIAGRLGAALLLGVLAWGTVRAQSPPNRSMSALASEVALRAQPGDLGAGPTDYFDRDETCLVPLRLPRHDFEASPAPEDATSVWVVHDKDDDDRFPPSMRRAMPGDLAERGYELDWERFSRPETHEEFGQIVLLSRYTAGAQPRRGPQPVTITVDASSWPLSRGPAAVRLVPLTEFPLRERPWDREALPDLPLSGPTSSVTATVDPEVVYGWEVVPAGELPLIGAWPRPLDQPPFTAYALDDLSPTITARLPAVWDPVLARAMLLALLALLPLLLVGAGVQLRER